MSNPIIIQGGMGIGVSNWRLARAVSKIGQLGVVSGTSLDGVLARRLQDGDPGGHMRRALDAFPFKDSAKRIIDKYFVPDGIKKEHNYTQVPMFKIENNDDLNELTVAANFTEIYLAKEGHDGLVGVNYMEKVQLPHLPSIYGALLAGIDYIIMGAGIPLEIPGILKKLVDNCKTAMKVNVENAPKEESFFTQFDPEALFGKKLPSLKMPRFLPIISSNFLATLMAKKASGPIDGFIIENFLAGGHNAPPRGKMNFDEEGEPVYGDRDMVDTEKIKELGLPFWLAGSYGGPDKLQAALASGAAGIQAGSIFALCKESAFVSDLKKQIIHKLSRNEEKISTDTKASPTSFPFKVIRLADSLSESKVFENRRKICNLGYLRTLYKKEDGTVGYRCPAESKAAYEKKGGTYNELTAGKKCLCNALFAAVGLPTAYKDGSIEKPLITIGSNVESIKELIKEKIEFSAKDVVDFILKPKKSIQ